MISVFATQMNGPAAVDQTSMDFELNGVTGPGRVTLCGDTQPSATNCIRTASFYSKETGIVYIASLVSTNGSLTVTVTSLTGSRISGTFENVPPNCAAPCSLFQITGGTFDVPFSK